MTIPFLIIICILLLLAYVFDITSTKTKVPSVILLLCTGALVKQIVAFFNITVPDLSPILPIFGTVGLILIVLEGSLELELARSKLAFIAKCSMVALLPFLILSFGLAYAFSYFTDTSLNVALSNAIPLAIISSSIAIPSARNLLSHDREFVTYESSLSDIFGVILFNFVIMNEGFAARSVGFFFLELLYILVVAFVATLLLAYLLNRIKHHIKFVPIILMVLLIYAVAKLYHLPALIFILLFGIFLGNLDELKRFRFIQRLNPGALDLEVRKLKDLTIEITFLIRALFFLLFGFLIEVSDLFNPDTVIWAVAITGTIFLLRYIFLKIFRIPSKPLVFIAPRGLITILLFLSIPANRVLGIVNNSLIIQVIILTALTMMIGLIVNKPQPVPQKRALSD